MGTIERNGIFQMVWVVAAVTGIDKSPLIDSAVCLAKTVNNVLRIHVEGIRKSLIQADLPILWKPLARFYGNYNAFCGKGCTEGIFLYHRGSSFWIQLGICILYNIILNLDCREIMIMGINI